MKHVQLLEDRLSERLTRSVRERTEQLHMLITKAAAKSLRETTAESNAQMPQDDKQAQKVMQNRPDSAIGAMLHKQASLDQVAIFLAKRTLERWMRILRPFASGPGLAVLISRIIHEEFTRTSPSGRTRGAASSPSGSGSPDDVMEIIPDPSDYLGAAFRSLAPLPDAVMAEPWVFIEDLEMALNLETAFNANPDHPLRPNSPAKKTMSRTSSSTSSRPHSVGSLRITSPKGCSGGLRRSGAFPWSDFQMQDGFRQTTMTNFSHKQLRKYPGPDTYGDVATTFKAPQRASWGRFPRAGDRRTLCTCTPLSQLSRYFEQEHVIAS